MVLNLLPMASRAPPATCNMPAFAIRGGAAAADAAFDLGLAKTRLEGLAYGTVTTLMMNAALRMFSSTPKALEAVPDDKDKAKAVRFDNTLKVIFGLCTSLSVALGCYTTTIFTLFSIYSKTALGMGLQSEYLQFFESCAVHRLSGFRSFIGTVLMFNVSWSLSLMISYKGKARWIALPPTIVSVLGLIHCIELVELARLALYS